MSKVYVIQEPVTRGPDGELKTKFDLRPAAIYGDVESLLHHDFSPLLPGPAVEELRRKLSAFTNEDYLVFTGSPVLIAIASAIAAKVTGGLFRALVWDRRMQAYISVDVDLRWHEHRHNGRK